MIERWAYKFRIYPDVLQDWLFRNTIGCCRVVYNTCLSQRQLEWHRSEPRYISSFDQIKELKALKAEFPFLKKAPHHALVQAIVDLDKAYRNFFDGRAKYPKFRKKFENESFRYPDPAQLKIEKDRIFLPKAGWVEMVMHREIVGTVSNVTVSRQGTYWYVSIQVECEIDEPMLKIGAAEGVDAGVVHGAVLSDGTVFDLPRVSEKEQRQVAAIQKTVARRQKGSKNRMKAVRRLQSLQARHTRRRRDAKHKMTTAIIRSVAVLCVEDLRVKNMTASARGTVEEPGSNVAQKAGLNRSILDVSPGETRFQYEYKMKREGGRIVFVNPAFTSQQCCCCLHSDAENRPDRDTFVCVSCGYEDCADANAAKNIKRKGLEALVARTGGHPGLACESSRVGGRKQEEESREAGNLGLETTASPVLQGRE
jgi:putative transposase